MSTESIKENVIRKVLQELIVPELKDIKNKIDVIEERINSTNTRIDALDEKIDTKIAALDEKVDLMNKFNERLFNLIHPGQK
jgi:flagellar capping protein FliD